LASWKRTSAPADRIKELAYLTRALIDDKMKLVGRIRHVPQVHTQPY